MQLNSSQKAALEILTSGRNCFVTGGAGTGKSVLIREYLDYCYDNGKEVIVTAPTGIAAINVGGSTLHKAFAVPIPAFDQNLKIIPASGKKGKSGNSETKNVDVIIIDEISMCRADVFGSVAEYIKKITAIRAENKSKIQSKKKRHRHREEEPLKTEPPQVVVVGDFYQLPPVAKQEEIDSLGPEITGFAFESPAWADLNFVTVELKQVMRQADGEFVANLNKLRVGDESCIEWINKRVTCEFSRDAITVCSTNAKANNINNEKRPKKGVMNFQAIIQNVKDEPAPKMLTIWPEARVIMLKNDENDRYQNGSFGVIKEIKDDEIEVDVGGELCTIKKHTWTQLEPQISTSEDGKKKVVMVPTGTFTQFPIRLGYAITIHKSQGQTYDAVNVDTATFAEGQLYVALSRCRSLQGLRFAPNGKIKKLLVSPKVQAFYGGGLVQKVIPVETIEKCEKPVTKIKSDYGGKREKTVTKFKSDHGGKRPGAGRKKKDYKTVVMRVPEPLTETIKKLIEDFQGR